MCQVFTPKSAAFEGKRFSVLAEFDNAKIKNGNSPRFVSFFKIVFLRRVIAIEPLKDSGY